MKFTNELGFPPAIVSAVTSQEYDGGGADIGVTTLIDTPQPAAIVKAVGDEVVEDVSDRIWALMGSSIHAMLERVEENALVEERFIVPWHPSKQLADHLRNTGWKNQIDGNPIILIGLKPDRLSLIDNTLDDYKMASVWEVILGVKPNKIWQLALYKELLELKGFAVDKARLIYIFRDWQMSKSGDEGYPPRQIQIVEPTLPSQAEVFHFIDDQLWRHFGPELAQCTPEERWESPTTYAVKKKGNKRATKLFDDEQAAIEMVNTAHTLGKGEFEVETRLGQWRRCKTNPGGKSYCPASKYCEQWKNSPVYSEEEQR